MRFDILVSTEDTTITRKNKSLWHAIGVLIAVAAGKAPAEVQINTTSHEVESAFKTKSNGD